MTIAGRRYRGYGRGMGWRGAVAMLALSVSVAAQPPVFHYADGRLTARIDGVPLGDVLDALARETGAEVRGEVLAPRDVTMRFDDLPIERAVDRLLGPQSFTLRYGADGRLQSIDLGGLPAGPPARPEDPETGAAPDLQWHRVPLTPGLQRALNREYAPLAAVIDAAAHRSNARVRAEATQLVVTTIETDPALRKSILGMSDAALAALLRQFAGQRVADVVGGIMGAARSFELRTKAARVLQELRTPAVTAGPG